MKKFLRSLMVGSFFCQMEIGRSQEGWSLFLGIEFMGDEVLIVSKNIEFIQLNLFFFH